MAEKFPGLRKNMDLQIQAQQILHVGKPKGTHTMIDFTWIMEH